MPLTTYKRQSEPGPQVVDEEHVVNIIVHCVYDLTQKSVRKSLAHLQASHLRSKVQPRLLRMRSRCQTVHFLQQYSVGRP